MPAVKSPREAIDIIIAPPWWKTWGAYISYAILMAGIIWGSAEYRSKSLRQKKLVIRSNSNSSHIRIKTTERRATNNAFRIKNYTEAINS